MLAVITAIPDISGLMQKIRNCSLLVVMIGGLLAMGLITSTKF
jgi:hypothetical protein